MNSLEEFTPEEILVLSSAISAQVKKAAQIEMAPTGVENKRIIKSRKVDMTVRIQAAIGRSYDRERDSTCQAVTQGTIALILKYAGVTGKPAQDLLRKVFTEQMELGKDAQKELLKKSGVAEALASFKSEVVSQLPKTHVLGTVKANVLIEKL